MNGREAGLQSQPERGGEGKSSCQEFRSQGFYDRVDRIKLVQNTVQ